MYACRLFKKALWHLTKIYSKEISSALFHIVLINTITSNVYEYFKLSPTASRVFVTRHCIIQTNETCLSATCHPIV